MHYSILRGRRTSLLLLSFGLALAVYLGWGLTHAGIVVLGWVALGILCSVVFLRPAIGLYAMLLAIPLVGAIDPGGQSTIVRYMGIVTFVAWAAGKLIKKESYLPILRRPLAPPLLAFVLIILFSGLWSNPKTWPVSAFSYVQLVGWVFMLLDLVDSPNRLRGVLLCFLIGGLLSAGLIVVQSIGDPISSEPWARPTGARGDPNYTAATYLFVLPYILLLTGNSKGWRRLVGLACSGLLTLAIMLTISRMGILLLIVVLIFRMTELHGIRNKAKYLLYVVAILLAVAPFIPWTKVEYRFSEVWSGDLRESLNGRDWLVSDAWESFLEHPVLGRGFGNPGTHARFVHNGFLQMLVELGALGLGTTVWMWIVAWNSLRIAHRSLGTRGESIMKSALPGVRLAFIVFFFISLGLSTTHIRSYWLLLALADICCRLLEPTSNVQYIE